MQISIRVLILGLSGLSAALAACSTTGKLDAAMGPATPSAVHAPSADYVTRVELLALVQTFNSELLSHDSATLTLERWCEVHHLASPARIVAERMRGVDNAASAQQRQELGVTADEPLRYRRVRLRCGSIVMSEAENWYVPARLTPDMNALLDATDTPFGKVVQALHFRRHTVASTLLWSPLPDGWDMRPGPASESAGELTLPAAVLRHQAVLSLPDGTPFSEVMETYTDQILAFRLLRHP